MRLVVISFLIILSLGVFGFPFLAGAGVMVDHGICMVAKVFGTSCPAGGVFGMALHHLTGAGEMTLAVVGFVAAFLAITVLVVLGVTDVFWNRHEFGYHFENSFIVEPNARFLRWLSFHNKRDPYVTYFSSA